MSQFFYAAYDRELVIFHMANRRAELFVALTRSAEEVYKRPGLSITREDDQYWVHSNLFCPLVEAVFQEPSDLLYIWATYASGFYQALKGKSYEWIWRGGTVGVDFQSQPIPLAVQYHSSAPRIVPSGKTIGLKETWNE